MIKRVNSTKIYCKNFLNLTLHPCTMIIKLKKKNNNVEYHHQTNWKEMRKEGNKYNEVKWNLKAGYFKINKIRHFRKREIRPNWKGQCYYVNL
jgi:uncharacterized protein YdgA (DUF945 family)